jgi:hypothetical protein
MLRLLCQLKLLVVVGILAAALAFPTLSQGADALTVKVADGKTYWGFVDSKTDDRLLWLRREQGTGMLRRGIAWERIMSASHQGQAVELSDLPKLAEQIASSRTIVVQRGHSKPAKLPMAAARRPVAALAIESAVANWDGDVETDGLMVDLRVLDDEGLETTADGTLEIELFAPRIRKYHEAPQSRGYHVDLIERWTVAVNASQFHRGVARVRLPFGAIHPEFDRGVDALGLIHARLAVPGDGVFDQSLDGITVRKFSPVRDALLDNTGRQFLPTEITGRGEGAYSLPRW